MKTRALLKKLSMQFPKSIAKKHHDFVGTMVGPLPSEVHRIALVLDLDKDVLGEILQFKPDLVMTHHPFFFGNKKRILEHDRHKKYVYDILKENSIAVISMHTNFDEGKGGMNDALAHALGFINIYAPEKEPMMRIGTLKEPQNVYDFAKYAKEHLQVDYALLVKEKHDDTLISKVGIIGGGGSRSFPIAMEEGCDIYISGDAPHYVRRDIIINGFIYLDVPHEVESIFVDQMKKILLQFDHTFEIATWKHEKMPEVIL